MHFNEEMRQPNSEACTTKVPLPGFASRQPPAARGSGSSISHLKGMRHIKEDRCVVAGGPQDTDAEQVDHQRCNYSDMRFKDTARNICGHRPAADGYSRPDRSLTHLCPHLRSVRHKDAVPLKWDHRKDAAACRQRRCKPEPFQNRLTETSHVSVKNRPAASLARSSRLSISMCSLSV